MTLDRRLPVPVEAGASLTRIRSPTCGDTEVSRVVPLIMVTWPPEMVNVSPPVVAATAEGLTCRPTAMASAYALVTASPRFDGAGTMTSVPLNVVVVPVKSCSRRWLWSVDRSAKFCVLLPVPPSETGSATVRWVATTWGAVAVPPRSVFSSTPPCDEDVAAGSAAPLTGPHAAFPSASEVSTSPSAAP